MRHDLQQFMETVKARVAIPEAINGIIDAIDASGCVASELALAIESDERMHQHILRLANSSYYSNVRGFDSVATAISVIGADEVRQLALGVGMMHSFRGLDVDGKALDCFWLHSIYCAIVAEFLSYETDPAISEAAFSAGLLHDVGLLLIALFLPEESELAHARSGTIQRETLVDSERDVIGFDHTDVGFEAAAAWRLPAFISDCARSHHCLPLAHTDPTLAAVVHIANNITALGPSFDDCSDPSPMHPEAWERANLDPSIVPQVVEEAQRQYHRVKALLFGWGMA